MRRTVDPRFGVDVPRSDGRRTERAKSFRFAVTWTSLTAHLELREAVARTSAAAAKAAPAAKYNQANLRTLAVITVPSAIEKPETQSESTGRWEMVVPKMVRADRVPRALTKAAPFGDELRNGDVNRPIPIPAFASLGTPLPPFLSKVLAVIGRRTRALLAAPDKPVDAPSWSRPDSPRLGFANGAASRSQVLQLNAPNSSIPGEETFAPNEDAKDRNAVRELLLSKITKALRDRSQSPKSTFAINQQKERWPTDALRDEPRESPLP